ncbi:MAG TPA: aldo/keto reductase [Armatimonadota bacterium]|nr:aldo/keto reductase [Armatimonadota bacterium]
MKRRVLGRTGEELSILGMGGIVVSELEQAEANRIVAEAVDRGVNYFDVAPSYGDAEERLGPALEPYRKDVFLACKTGSRDRDGSAKDLETSLKRLRTDHVDVYQLHGLMDLDDVEKAFGPGGAIETFEAAKRDGKARFLGFSAHAEEAALAALDRFPFDSVLFPFNFACWSGGFGPQVMEAAKAKGMGRLALKAAARTFWSGEEQKHPKCWYEPYDDPDTARLAFYWTLSQDVTAAVSPGQHELFPMMLDLAEKFRPITPEEEQQLRGITEGLTPIFPQEE